MYEIYARLRDSRGLTDYRISEEIGISRAMLSSWKNGKYTPKIDKLQKIADFFGIPLEYLMTGEMPEQSYYTDKETAKIMQKLFESPGKHALAKAIADMTEEQAKIFADFVEGITRIDNYKNNQDA